MDIEIHTDGVYSQEELIEKGKKLIANGDRRFLDAKIDAENMTITQKYMFKFNGYSKCSRY